MTHELQSTTDLNTHRAVPTALALVSTLLLAATLRLYGLRWEDGIRNYPHPDERHLANTMSRISLPSPLDWRLLNDPDHSPLNPRRLIPGTDEHYDLAYGTLPVYLYRATAVVVARVAGNSRWDSYYAYGLIGRTITVLFSLLTVVWIYETGRRTFGQPTALLGAALLTVSVSHIQLSHFMTVDLLMSAMLMLGMSFAVRFAQGGSNGDATAVGLALGLSMASKFSGITLGAGIATAYAVAWLGGKRQLSDLLAYCAPLTVAGWALSFGVFEYYAVRDPYTYAEAIGVQARMVSGETDWPYTRQYVNTTPYIYHLRNVVVWGLGWPLGVAAWTGMAFSAVAALFGFARGEPTEPSLRRRKGWLKRWFGNPAHAGLLTMLGWALPFFAYIGRLEVKFLRYMLPLVPILCLFAAHLIIQFAELLIRAIPALQQARVGRRAVHGISVGLVVIPTLLWALAYMRVYADVHPWRAGSIWFYNNAPRGSVYTWEAWGDPLPIDLPSESLYRSAYGYRDLQMQIYHDMAPTEKLEHIAQSLRQADFVVLSTPRIYLSVACLPWRYPVEIRYYELLFTERLGYELAAKFAAFPGLGPFRSRDVRADQSFYDYDHPLVLIYRKTRDLSDQEWRSLFAAQLEADPQVTRQGDQSPVRLPIP